MLVLKRSLDEVVVIVVPGFDPIRIKVLKVGHSIKLGFEAGDEVEVYREELIEKNTQT